MQYLTKDIPAMQYIIKKKLENLKTWEAGEKAFFSIVMKCQKHASTIMKHSSGRSPKWIYTNNNDRTRHSWSKRREPHHKERSWTISSERSIRGHEKEEKKKIWDKKKNDCIIRNKCLTSGSRHNLRSHKVAYEFKLHT